MPEFQPYLDSIDRHYSQRCKYYTLMDAEGQQKQESVPLFDFGLEVQTIVPKDELELGDRSQPKIERFPVTEGLQKYAIDHVLLVGRPGSGKSTALARLMFDLVKGSQIPVLVELRSYQSSILELIRSAFKRHDLSLTIAEIETVLDDRKLILLIDGVNELPSESARIDLSNFRRDHSKVPMIFTTRDLGLGGDLGIEKKLEMQPLTETQMKSFIHAYLPGKADAMLGQLRDRLREFGTTPLLLWMLCSLFARTETIPQNLGEVFRAFTRGYEQQVKQDVVLESDRRLWPDLLKQLAAAMMQGDKPTEFRVAIAPAEICAVFAEYLKSENPLVPRQALDDLLRHHLIQRNGDLVEFRHQLIQEYYAAEWLLERVGTLDDETLECDYLNYLKWTEPLAVMLALMDDEKLAVRVVDRALAVDLMLGARLTGEVRSGLHKETVGLVSAKEVPDWLKVEMWGKTRSDIAIPKLLKAVEYPNFKTRWRAIDILGEIGSNAAIPGLLKVIEDSDLEIRWRSAKALGMIGSTISTPFLLKAIEDDERDVCTNAVRALGKISSETVFLTLIKHSNLDVRESAAKVLGEIGSEAAVPALLKSIEDSDCDVRQSVVEALGAIGSGIAIPALLKAIEDPYFFVRNSAAEALGKIGSDTAIPKLLNMALEHSDSGVRGAAAAALREIGSDLAINALRQADPFPVIVIFSQKDALGEVSSFGASRENQYSKVSILILLQAIDDPDPKMRRSAINRMAQLDSDIVINPSLTAIQDSDLSVRRIAVDMLKNVKYDRAAHILPNLLQLLPTESGKDAFNVIQGIQSNCKFYNYEIEQQAKLRKADRTSSEGGGGDLSLATIERQLNTIDRRTQKMAEQPSTISISGGTFNAPVNLASNHGHQPTTINGIQNTYESNPEIESAIADLKTLITELQTKYPNVTTETEALEIIDIEFTEIIQNPSHKFNKLGKQILNPERHFQAIKATIVEVAKKKLDQSLIATMFVTYADKLSETPDKGA